MYTENVIKVHSKGTKLCMRLDSNFDANLFITFIVQNGIKL